MELTTILFGVVFAVLIVLYVRNCEETFYIDPGMIRGGAFEQTGVEMGTDGHWRLYSAPLELEGPGDAAWDGY